MYDVAPGRPIVVLIAVAVATLSWLARPARAQAAGAACDVYEIAASHDGKGIDAGLGKLAKTLGRPPFNSWSSFKLVGRHHKQLIVAQTVRFALAVGGSFELALKAVTRKGSATRLRIGVVLTNKRGKATRATTEIDSGEAFLIGGEPLPGKPRSAYFVGIACTAQR